MLYMITFSLSQAFMNSEKNNKEESHDGDKDDAHDMHEKKKELLRLSRMNVSCSVLVGNIFLSLSEFMELKHGSILSLKTQVGDELALVVNNQLFAHGVLVEENDHVAFRIVSLVG